MKSGIGPTPIDHRDFDFFKSKRFGALIPPFVENYSVYAGLRVPNQQLPDTHFTPPVPAMPYGCTNYAQCEICTNEDGVLYDPSYIESFTNANANGGGDIRKALKAIKDHGLKDQQGNIITGKHPAFFNIQQAGAIDYFDAVRLAMLSTSSEKRGVSIGSPFWLQWSAVGPSGILPPPDYDLHFATWHNWVGEGWKTIDGTTYLVCQMLQGDTYGDKGFVYMTRQMFNATMNVRGSVAFTIDKLMPGESAVPVDTSIIDWIVSYVRSLFL